MSQTRQFRAPAVISNGPGAAKEAGAYARQHGRKALIVTDSNLEKIGLLADVKASLEAAGVGYAVYDKVVMEPVVEYVDDGLRAFREAGADVVVAVGGGSPIDMGKAIAALSRNPGTISDFMGANKLAKPSTPLIAIPTTAGTGSEVTPFTIITNTETDVKMLISSPHLIPAVALVDPLMTMKMPRGITAATGLDALTHAIEAYVSVKAQPLTDTFALQAIRLISGNLRRAYSQPDDIEARSSVLIGALQAGLAFANSSVALVHGMARPIGAYFHVAHGISNAVLLPTVIEFSVPGNPRRYADIAEAMGEQTKGRTVDGAAKKTVEAVKRLNADLQIPTLRGLKIDEAKFEAVVGKMATDAIASGSPGNNPRIATPEEIVALYRKAL
ncbi:MAG: iron-containing alcohol dehydrogenase [Candidatus Bathyarchaeota archaeon]|nr:iron-containing alcohol dehydrogenase [Candidatus Bathyarchaeota archaeon]